MPIKNNTNNRILPNNSRNADVASAAVSHLTPIAQQRMYNAFRVQGLEAIVYNKVLTGPKCSCHGSRSVLGAKLGLDGKASEGVINSLLTGHTFDVTPYSDRKQSRPIVGAFDVDDGIEELDGEWEKELRAPVSQFKGEFDIRETEANGGNNDTPGFGDNGVFDPDIDLDDMVQYDAGTIGLGDGGCAVCFGTGIVGGYAPFQAVRIVAAAHQMEINGSLDTEPRTFVASATELQYKCVLPFGALAVDAFHVWNNMDLVAANFSVDNTPVRGNDILKYCDGRVHTIQAKVPAGKFTHLELQFSVSSESAYLEFPKLTKSGDQNKVDSTESFQIVLSPNVPIVRPADIIVESRHGRVLMVDPVTEWITRDRATLGWELSVRVVQSTEIYTDLPRRGRPAFRNLTTLGQHDNMSGVRRT